MKSITVLVLGEEIKFETVLNKNNVPFEGEKFAVDETEHGPVLLTLSLHADNRAPTEWDVGEVTCVEDGQDFIDSINKHFGTHFTFEHFGGR